MKLFGAARALFSLVTLAACDVQSTSQSYPVLFLGKSDEGDPLANVGVVVSGQAVGVTDEHGKLHSVLTGKDGDHHTIEAQCPKGFSLMDGVPPLILRQVEGPSGALGSEVTVRCQPDKRMAALLVSTPGFANLPVLLHGQEVARTDAAGIAHVVLEAPPRTPLRVVLDTSVRPRIEPASPNKDIRVGARDEIVVFAPELKEPPPPKPKARSKRKPSVEAPAPQPVMRPERL